MSEPTEDERALLAPRRGAVRSERSYAVSRVEVRASAEADHLREFLGWASVTGKGYDMYGGPKNGGWIEYVDRGAFAKTLGEHPDVMFLANHAGLPMARTVIGTLTLSEDRTGLKTEATFDTRKSYVNDVVLNLEDGSLNEMSFAFRVVRQIWLNDAGDEVPWWDLDGIERHIVEVDMHQGDVSIVNYGANPYAGGALRSTDILSELALLDPAALLAEVRSGEGPDPLVGLRAAHDVLTRAVALIPTPAAEPAADVAGITLAEARERLAAIA